MLDSKLQWNSARWNCRRAAKQRGEGRLRWVLGGHHHGKRLHTTFLYRAGVCDNYHSFRMAITSFVSNPNLKDEDKAAIRLDAKLA